MPTKAKLNTTASGLGHRHQIAVEGLFDALPPVGHPRNPCDWCGRPRHKDRTRNWDYRPASTNPAGGKLQGDHSKMSRSEALRRGLPIPPPDRLLHGECNRARGDGSNDHLAWINTGKPPVMSGDSATAELAMPWPW
jgi:hypothetical protein